eukprot:6553956-Pyramimonas_sp.AAC.1
MGLETRPPIGIAHFHQYPDWATQEFSRPQKLAAHHFGNMRTTLAAQDPKQRTRETGASPKPVWWCKRWSRMVAP